LTAHCLNKQWNLNNLVLAINEFVGSHTHDAIANHIRDLLTKWMIDIKKVHAFVSDAAANMKKVFAN